MQDYIKICPNCGSTNLSFFGTASTTDFCKDCGYGKSSSDSPMGIQSQQFFPEIDKRDIKSFKKNLKKGEYDSSFDEVSLKSITTLWKTRLSILILFTTIFIYGVMKTTDYPDNIFLVSFIIILLIFSIIIFVKAVQKQKKSSSKKLNKK